MEMISFEKAFGIVMGSEVITETEKIDFRDSSGRILAENVVSDTDMPPFDKASMDGYACRLQDLDLDLEIVDTIPAGKYPERNISRGECSKIMTGAQVPAGADCIVIVEDTEVLPSGKIRITGNSSKHNIAFKGEDIIKGDVVLQPGKLIKPQDIAVMASVGHTSVRVSRSPDVAIISSGSELVEPWELPGISQIRNSNSFQLMAQAGRTGARSKYYGIAKDNEEETFLLIKKAISENDLTIISGGVSVGEFDFVPAVMKRAGVDILFSRLAIKPGKPTTFGKVDGKFVFGLPGNPVSSFMLFELLVRPFIYRIMGYDWKPLRIKLALKEDISRKYSDRMALLPVIITDDNEVKPVEYHGSAHISALPHAFGIIEIPVGINRVKKGEIVSVRQI